jgi:hypothetical protein
MKQTSDEAWLKAPFQPSADIRDMYGQIARAARSFDRLIRHPISRQLLRTRADITPQIKKPRVSWAQSGGHYRRGGLARHYFAASYQIAFPMAAQVCKQLRLSLSMQ